LSGLDVLQRALYGGFQSKPCIGSGIRLHDLNRGRRWCFWRRCQLHRAGNVCSSMQLRLLPGWLEWACPGRPVEELSVYIESQRKHNPSMP